MVEQHIGRRFAMVKIGFIYDGETEQVILNSKMFKDFLGKYNFELAGMRKYVGGKIARDTNMLIKRNNAEKVIIIKDLEQLADKESVLKELKKKEKISNNNSLVIVKRMIEAWFLADNETMGRILRNKIKPFNNPENEINPHRTLQNKLGRGYQDLGKPAIANLFITNGFTIENAAKHSQCHSAKEFIKTIEELEKVYKNKNFD